VKSILIVEDNEANMYLARYILENSGFNVIEARNGLDGVQKATTENVDLILMDIQLPDIDGLEATKRIREQKVDLPIVALTSYAMPEDKTRSLDAGCTGYMTKPVNPETIVNQINDYLSKTASIPVALNESFTLYSNDAPQ